LTSEKQALSIIRALAYDARSIGKEAFVFGARSVSLVSGAVGFGIRFIEGEAIWPLVTNPKHVFTHDPTDSSDRHVFVD
jgi:hypothetical protein